METQTITKDMRIGDVVRKYPQTIEVFLRHGLMCVGCHAAQFEDIEQGSLAHGIEVDRLMKALNKALAET